MKPASAYASLAEIYADADLNIVQRARAVDAFNALHVNDPQPLLTPDADERRRLENHREKLTDCRSEWLALETLEKKFTDWLPAAADRLRTLEALTPPDAPDSEIDTMLRLTRRVQLGQQFIGGIQPRREAINRAIIAAFFELNALVRKFSADRFPGQFFMSGTTPVPVIADALKAIDALLK